MAEKRTEEKKMGTEVSVCPDGFCVHRTSFRLTTSKGKTNPIFQHSYVINWQYCGRARGTNTRFFNTVTTYLILHTSIFPFGFFWVGGFCNSKKTHPDMIKKSLVLGRLLFHLKLTASGTTQSAPCPVCFMLVILMLRNNGSIKNWRPYLSRIQLMPGR